MSVSLDIYSFHPNLGHQHIFMGPNEQPAGFSLLLVIPTKSILHGTLSKMQMCSCDSFI